MPTASYRRRDDIVFERVDDRVMLLDRAGMEMVTLNPVGSVVWELLDEPKSVGDLVAALSTRFPEVGTERLTGDVEAFLGEMVEVGYVDGDAHD